MATIIPLENKEVSRSIKKQKQYSKKVAKRNQHFEDEAALQVVVAKLRKLRNKESSGVLMWIEVTIIHHHTVVNCHVIQEAACWC